MDRPTLTLLDGADAEDMVALEDLFESLTGRRMTEEEIAECEAELNDESEKE